MNWGRTSPDQRLSVSSEGDARSSEGEVGLVLIVAAAATALPLLTGTSHWSLLAGLGLAMVLSLARHWRVAARLSLFFGLVFLHTLDRQLGPWPLPLLVKIGLFILVLRIVPAFGDLRGVLRRGRFDRGALAAGVGFALVASCALAAWFELFQPASLKANADLYLSDHPQWLILVGIPLFAVLNATAEEFAYRGVLLDALQRSLTSTVLVVTLQAIPFGTLHIHGFPSGPVGIALAMAYGMMTGFLRIHSGGLLAPWFCHVLTNTAMGYMLVVWFR